MIKLTPEEIEEETERIQEEYEYMDDMPLKAWMWEIIRRSNDYRVFYEKWYEYVQKPANDKTYTDKNIWKEYLEKYSPIFPHHPNRKAGWPLTEWSDKEEWPSLILGKGVTKLRPFLTANLAIGFGIDTQHGDPIKSRHPAIVKKERDFQPGRYILFEKKPECPSDHLERDNRTTYTVEDYPPLGPEKWSEQPNGKMIWFQNYPLIEHPIEILYAHQGMENVVMTLIDLSVPESIDSILKSLKEELLLWKKILKLSNKRSPKSPKKKSNKLINKARIWKSYLIVYDLVTAGKSFNAVSEILSMIDDFYSDVKNIENHYKDALALINGGYRKYM